MLFVIRASIGTSGAISHYTPNHTIDNLSNVCTLAMYIQPTYAPTTRIEKAEREVKPIDAITNVYLIDIGTTNAILPVV